MDKNKMRGFILHLVKDYRWTQMYLVVGMTILLFMAFFGGELK